MLRLPLLLVVALLGILLGILRFLLRLPLPRAVPPWASIRLEGRLLWQAPKARSLAERLRKPAPSVAGVEALLDALAKEPKVRGVVVELGNLHASLPRLEALSGALQRFRAGGREVVLYWKEASGRELALAPAADRILLAPGGTVTVVGASTTLTSLRGALDRFGVQPEFFRIGDHKTAPELFTEKEPSEIQRAFVEKVLDARFRRLVAHVASRRDGNEAWAKQVIDGGPYTSQRAVDAGLVDALVYPDELAAYLSAPTQPSAGPAEGPTPMPAKRPTLRSAEAIVASRRWRAWTPRLTRPPRILVLPISGLIKGGKSANLPTGPSMVGEESVVAQIDAARKDPKVRGVVIYADSRGGAAPASELIWRAVLRCAKEKPTAAYVETVAASGGYFAVAGAGRIFSAPGALVGSIGVFSGRFDVRQLLERLGVHREAHLRGAHAGLLNSAHPLGPEERRVLEAEIRQVYEDFLARVAEGRKLPVEAIEPHAEGRVFLGADAPKELVDEVGDLRDAVGWVCAQAKVDPAKAETVVLRPRSTGLRSLPALVQSVAAMGRMHLWLLAPPTGE